VNNLQTTYACSTTIAEDCLRVFGSFWPGNLLKNKRLAFYFAVAIFIFFLLYDIYSEACLGRPSQRLAIKSLHLHIDM